MRAVNDEEASGDQAALGFIQASPTQSSVFQEFFLANDAGRTEKAVGESHDPEEKFEFRGGKCGERVPKCVVDGCEAGAKDALYGVRIFWRLASYQNLRCIVHNFLP